MSALDDLRARLFGADLAIFHEFQKPPFGGGNQFLLALRSELTHRGVKVVDNRMSPGVRACLFNSYNFDADRLAGERRVDCRMVHRVDGPIGEYRGSDDGTDRRIEAVNQRLADATVFQSEYSLKAHEALGLRLKSPTVIMNAVDPRIFHSDSSARRGEKIRLISTSWSTNPNKGSETYRWIEQNLDWDRFEYTFVGRSPIQFERIRTIPALPSRELANMLREHDVYITASLHDPCSNALLEALACGLPAIYARSGGHPEIVKDAGFGFDRPEEIPQLLDRLVNEYDQRRDLISIPTLGQVADRYAEVLGL